MIAKYLVEAYYEKEAKITKKKAYYDKLIKQPWGVVDQYPPRERYEYERIRDLSKQRWIRKFPPIATCGDESYKRFKQHGQVCNLFIIIILLQLSCCLFWFLHSFIYTQYHCI